MQRYEKLCRKSKIDALNILYGGSIADVFPHGEDIFPSWGGHSRCRLQKNNVLRERMMTSMLMSSPMICIARI